MSSPATPNLSLPSFLFDSALPGLGRPLCAEEGHVIIKYLELLIKWQKVHRLVGSVEPRSLARNVVADSLAFLGAIPSEVETLADVGSGAGLPGVPIAIVRRTVRICLIEARQRRVSFLSAVVRELGLDHVEVIGTRVESLGDMYAGRFDAVVSRCAGAARELLPKVWYLARDAGVIVLSAGVTGAHPIGAERVTINMGDGSTRSLHRYVKAGQVPPGL